MCGIISGGYGRTDIPQLSLGQAQSVDPYKWVGQTFLSVDPYKWVGQTFLSVDPFRYLISRGYQPELMHAHIYHTVIL